MTERWRSLSRRRDPQTLPRRRTRRSRQRFAEPPTDFCTSSSNTDSWLTVSPTFPGSVAILTSPSRQALPASPSRRGTTTRSRRAATSSAVASRHVRPVPKPRTGRYWGRRAGALSDPPLTSAVGVALTAAASETVFARQVSVFTPGRVRPGESSPTTSPRQPGLSRRRAGWDVPGLRSTRRCRPMGTLPRRGGRRLHRVPFTHNGSERDVRRGKIRAKVASGLLARRRERHGHRPDLRGGSREQSDHSDEGRGAPERATPRRDRRRASKGPRRRGKPAAG